MPEKYSKQLILDLKKGINNNIVVVVTSTELCTLKVEYTKLFSVQGTVSKVHHIVGHKAYFHKINSIEILSTIFSDHDALNMEVNYKQKWRDNFSTVKLNSSLLNNQIV